MKRLVRSCSMRLWLVGMLLLVCKVALAQPQLELRSISVNYPEITLNVGVKCDTAFPNYSNQNFKIKDGGREVNQFTLNCPASNRYCCISVALVVDRSGSMGWGTPTSLQGAKDGVKAFIDRMDGNCDEATLISFASNVTVDVFMTNDKVLLKAGVDALVAAGGTAVWDACVEGITELVNNATQECKEVIVVTDGEDNASTNNTVADVIAAAQAANVRIVTIGLGTGINEADLKQIANETNGKYYAAANPSQLVGFYRQINTELSIRFTQCEIKYTTTAPCLNGSTRKVDVTLQGLTNCPGSVTKSMNYQLPRDTSTFQNVTIRLGSDSVRCQSYVDIPLILETSIQDSFPAFSFDLFYDYACVQFIGFQTSGFLLAGMLIDVQPNGSGFRFTFFKPTFINGSGILAMLRFGVQSSYDRDCLLRLANFNFNSGCSKIGSLIDGNIRVRVPSLGIILPGLGENLCAGSTYPIKWQSKNIDKIKIELSQDGGFTYSLIATDVDAFLNSYQWTIPLNQTPGTRYLIRLSEIGACLTQARGLNTFQINSPPIITLHPGDKAVCAGDSVIFTATVSGSPTPSMQWQVKAPNDSIFGDIFGETQSTLVLRNVSSTLNRSQYRGAFSNSCASNVPTNPAILTVGSSIAPAITSHPGNVTTCMGSSVKLSVQATGFNLTYQWRKNGVNIPGATDTAFTFVVASRSDTGRYDAVVKGQCAPSSVTSNTANVTIGVAPTITSQPKNATLCEGASTTLTIGVAGASATYQWRKNSAPISGANNASFTIPVVTLSDAGTYDVLINGDCLAAPLTSSGAILTVNPLPSVLTQPTNQTACEGASVTFTVLTSNATVLQWRKNGAIIPGATSSTLIVSPVTFADTGNYFVEVTNSCGTKSSGSASLVVGKTTTILQQPTSQTVNENGSVTFSVNAQGSNVTYQWQKDGVDIPGATSSSYTIAKVKKSDEGNYAVIVRGQCGVQQSGNARLSVLLVGVENTTAIPLQPILFQNYPNPFGTASRSTSEWSNISFTLPQKEFVRIVILDVLGRERIVLTNQLYETGEHAVRVDSKSLTAGMYLYQLRTTKFSLVKRMTVLK